MPDLLTFFDYTDNLSFWGFFTFTEVKRLTEQQKSPGWKEPQMSPSPTFHEKGEPR